MMFGIDNTGSALDTVAHIIQVALTPVFLLSGIATLLNVFSSRLARVADLVHAASDDSKAPTPSKLQCCRRGSLTCIAGRWRSMSRWFSAVSAGRRLAAPC